MRNSKITAQEVEAAEIAADERRRSRNNGFSLMSVRDRGWTRLNNGVVMLWPTDREPMPGEAITSVPKGKFVLVINGKSHLFDADDFQKSLRWV